MIPDDPTDADVKALVETLDDAKLQWAIDERRLFKMAAFGTAYGMTPDRMAGIAQVSVEDARLALAQWRANLKYPAYQKLKFADAHTQAIRR